MSRRVRAAPRDSQPRALPGAVLIAALAVTSACTLTGYERGLVRRVESHKSIDRGDVIAQAVRIDAGHVGVLLRRTSHVRIERQAIYQTIVGKAEWLPWMEPLELLVSPIYLPVTMLLAAFAMDDTPNHKMPASTRWKIAFAPINPFCTVFGMTLRRSEVSDEEHFRDEPHTIRFPMHLPLADHAVTWRALSADGSQTAAGTATTDPFGRLIFAETDAATIAIKGDGWQVTASLAGL